jgi:hypothetical protein
MAIIARAISAKTIIIVFRILVSPYELPPGGG